MSLAFLLVNSLKSYVLVYGKIGFARAIQESNNGSVENHPVLVCNRLSMSNLATS